MLLKVALHLIYTFGQTTFRTFVAFLTSLIESVDAIFG